MTPLKRVAFLRKDSGFPNLYIKDESKNRFGTWKDRRSKFIIKKAVSSHVKKLCLITSGNAGFSLAKFARPYGIKIVCIIDKNIASEIKRSIRKAVYRVIEKDLSRKIYQPEEVISMSRENTNEVIWDVTNGYEDAYQGIIDELNKIRPDIIVCPVGSGEAFVGLYDEIEKKKWKTRLVGVSPKRNPSLADKLSRRWTPYAAKLKAITKRKHKLIQLSEKEIREAYGTYGKYCSCEPSSSIVFGVLGKGDFPSAATIVLINSGKGLI